jgi:hypothetical protein
MNYMQKTLRENVRLQVKSRVLTWKASDGYSGQGCYSLSSTTTRAAGRECKLQNVEMDTVSIFELRFLRHDSA